jgi:muconolactone delta-isomerase
MRILAIERDLDAVTRPDLNDILRTEAAAVWDLQKHGVIRDIWSSASHHKAVLILECASAAEARDHLAALPLARLGLTEFELIELGPYDGYERLLGAGSTPASKHEAPAEY